MALQVRSVLRKMRLVVVGLSWSAVEVLVAPSITTGDRHARLGHLADKEVGVQVSRAEAHVAHAWATTAAHDPLPLVGLAGVLLILTLVIGDHLL